MPKFNGTLHSSQINIFLKKVKQMFVLIKRLFNFVFEKGILQ